MTHGSYRSNTASICLFVTVFWGIIPSNRYSPDWSSWDDSDECDLSHCGPLCTVTPEAWRGPLGALQAGTFFMPVVFGPWFVSFQCDSIPALQICSLMWHFHGLVFSVLWTQWQRVASQSDWPQAGTVSNTTRQDHSWQKAPAKANFKSGVSNSIYLGAAGGRVWVRLGHIRYSTKKSFVKKKKKSNLLKCHY